MVIMLLLAVGNQLHIEFMRLYGYGHSSNMTYASGGVGWTEFMWQLHTYLRGNDWLPYTDRNLLVFISRKTRNIVMVELTLIN